MGKKKVGKDDNLDFGSLFFIIIIVAGTILVLSSLVFEQINGINICHNSGYNGFYAEHGDIIICYNVDGFNSETGGYDRVYFELNSSCEIR